jgi:ABC-type multidrug transport system ATPase subunit
MALTITGLSKTYPNGVRALKNVSLEIGNNMFGLLGPNGAGKSSLMRTVATLQAPIPVRSPWTAWTFSLKRTKFAKSSAIFPRSLESTPGCPHSTCSTISPS